MVILLFPSVFTLCLKGIWVRQSVRVHVPKASAQSRSVRERWQTVKMPWQSAPVRQRSWMARAKPTFPTMQPVQLSLLIRQMLPIPSNGRVVSTLPPATWCPSAAQVRNAS